MRGYFIVEYVKDLEINLKIHFLGALLSEIVHTRVRVRRQTDVVYWLAAAAVWRKLPSKLELPYMYIM